VTSGAKAPSFHEAIFGTIEIVPFHIPKDDKSCIKREKEKAAIARGLFYM
jgi:hypothetical protein